MESGQEFTFTIRRGVGTADCVSVNYDDFVNDVEPGDMLLVDGMLKFYFFFGLTTEVMFIFLCTLTLDLCCRWYDVISGEVQDR